MRNKTLFITLAILASLAIVAGCTNTTTNDSNGGDSELLESASDAAAGGNSGGICSGLETAQAAACDENLRVTPAGQAQCDALSGLFEQFSCGETLACGETKLAGLEDANGIIRQIPNEEIDVWENYLVFKTSASPEQLVLLDTDTGVEKQLTNNTDIDQTYLDMVISGFKPELGGTDDVYISYMLAQANSLPQGFKSIAIMKVVDNGVTVTSPSEEVIAGSLLNGGNTTAMNPSIYVGPTDQKNQDSVTLHYSAGSAKAPGEEVKEYKNEGGVISTTQVIPFGDNTYTNIETPTLTPHFIVTESINNTTGEITVELVDIVNNEKTNVGTVNLETKPSVWVDVDETQATRIRVVTRHKSQTAVAPNVYEYTNDTSLTLVKHDVIPTTTYTNEVDDITIGSSLPNGGYSIIMEDHERGDILKYTYIVEKHINSENGDLEYVLDTPTITERSPYQGSDGTVTYVRLADDGSVEGIFKLDPADPACAL